MRPSCCRVPGLGAMLGATLFLSATAQQAPRPQTLVKAGRLIDGRSDAPQANVGILVAGERIVAVGPPAQVQGQAKSATGIDLPAPAPGQRARRRQIGRAHGRTPVNSLSPIPSFSFKKKKKNR